MLPDAVPLARQRVDVGALNVAVDGHAVGALE
jgi:hypothetical protein